MTIQALTIADLPHAAELQPHDWPQILPHLEYYVHQPFCHPLKMMDGNRMVGIGTTIIHHDVAWLAHILVHDQFRNQGIGKYITQALIDSVPSSVKTIFLIATHLGEPVYTKLNFVIDTEQVFYKRMENYTEVEGNLPAKSLEEKHKQQVLELGCKAYGEDRAFRLAEHLSNSFVIEEGNKVLGFYLPSFGDGLIVAEDEVAGIALTKYRAQSMAYAVTMAENEPANDFLKKYYGTEFRRAKRMRLGEKRTTQLEWVYNRVGGQIG
jgi:GNAT superfamily N-acetyltransferase